jgi:stage V sporulation protein B
MSLPVFLKPLVAAGVMGAAILGVLCAASGLGGWVLLLCIPVAAIVYGVVLTFIGGLTKEDLESLPYLGSRILRIGQRLGAFKE